MRDPRDKLDDQLVPITFKITRRAQRELDASASRMRRNRTEVIVSGLPRSVIRANRKRRQR